MNEVGHVYREVIPDMFMALINSIIDYIMRHLTPDLVLVLFFSYKEKNMKGSKHGNNNQGKSIE